MKETFEKINNRLAEEQLQAEKDCGLADTFNEASRCGGRAEAYENAQKIVSEVEAEYNNKSTEHINKSGYCSRGWIPCSERLPNVGEIVILWVYGQACIGKRIDAKLFEEYDVFSLERGACESTKRIKAWQPLPHPYEEEGGEDE